MFVDDEQKPEDVDLDQPSFSLITGKYRHARRYGGTTFPIVSGFLTLMVELDPKSVTSTANEPSSAVAIRNQDNSVSVLADSAAGKRYYDI
jgi:diphthamide biosynthesis protein 2